MDLMLNTNNKRILILWKESWNGIGQQLPPLATIRRTKFQIIVRKREPNWRYVAYNYMYVNIALFTALDGKCKDYINQTSWLYTTDCDDSTRTFYLTINNVTDNYNGKTIHCSVTHSTRSRTDMNSVINVHCKSLYIAY
jgi:hypothetical protein